MRWHKLILVTLKSIARNKMRSLLTMLGIIIGVASVITMVALGEGSQKDIEGEVASLGTNLLMVRPGSIDTGGVRGGAGSRPSLTMKDVARLEKNGTQLRWVSAEVRASGQVIAGNNNWNTTITGVAPNYLSIRNYEMERGTFFTARDSKTRAKVAVLGKTVADELFPDSDPIGERLRIRNVPFKVIGVMAEKGQSSMGNDQDDIIFAPDNTEPNTTDYHDVFHVCHTYRVPLLLEVPSALHGKARELFGEVPDIVQFVDPSEVLVVANKILAANE